MKKRYVISIFIIIVIIGWFIIGGEEIMGLLNPMPLEEVYSEDLIELKQIGEQITENIEDQFRALEELVLRLDTSVSDKILRELITYSETIESMNVYYGLENGDMIIYPEVNLPDGYDPTVRPWYTSSKEKGAYFANYAGLGDHITSLAVRTSSGVVGVDVFTQTLLPELDNNLMVFSENNDIIWPDEAMQSLVFTAKDWASQGEMNGLIYQAVTLGQAQNIVEYNNRVILMVKNNRGWTLVKMID